MGNSNPKLHKARRGLDLPISGAPNGENIRQLNVSTVALVASDYKGMKPSFSVKVGDTVKRGQELFTDRKTHGVVYTSPAQGEIVAINRGERRAFQSLVIRVGDSDENDGDNEVTYPSYKGADLASQSSADIRQLLIESGLWTALRTRPYSKVPATDTSPRSIFVTAMDSNPLAAPVDAVMKGSEAAFATGMGAIAKLADGTNVYLCKAAGQKLPAFPEEGIEVHEFAGKHPSGTVGFHIHRIDPVNRERVAWHIGYQDVIALGQLVQTGKQLFSRTISLSGPPVKSPSLVKTRIGASVDSLCAGELKDGDVCLISGSVFSGTEASGEITGYLGRYHTQVTVLENDRSRRFIGWLSPGFNIFSVTRLFGSLLTPHKKFAFTTDRFGGARTMLPFGSYEKVMAFDLMPVFLLRALLAGDLESAEELGCLELDEEDLALCTFVCPSKNEFGPALRDVLNNIEKEG